LRYAKNLIFFYNSNFFKVIEKTEQTLSVESFFKTLIDLSLDFFQKLYVTFSFGCFQIFWTHYMYLQKFTLLFFKKKKTS
jgi:hypothetical protein